MQGILDFLESISIFFSVVIDFISNLISMLIAFVEYLVGAVGYALGLIPFLPYSIAAGVMLTLTIGVINRLTFGGGGG